MSLVSRMNSLLAEADRKNKDGVYKLKGKGYKPDKGTSAGSDDEEEMLARELAEMEALLKKWGYNPKDAKRLAKEGRGPEELLHILKTTKSGEMGSLEYTHGLKKLGEEKNDLAGIEDVLSKHGYDPKDAGKLAKAGLSSTEILRLIKGKKAGEKGSLEDTHGLKMVWEAKNGTPPDLEDAKQWVASLETNAKRVYAKLFGPKPSVGSAGVQLGSVVRDAGEVLRRMGYKSADAVEAVGRTIQDEALGRKKEEEKS